MTCDTCCDGAYGCALLVLLVLLLYCACMTDVPSAAVLPYDALRRQLFDVVFAKRCVAAWLHALLILLLRRRQLMYALLHYCIHY